MGCGVVSVLYNCHSVSLPIVRVTPYYCHLFFIVLCLVYQCKNTLAAERDIRATMSNP